MKKIIAGLSVLGVAALGFGALAEGYVPQGDLHSKVSVTTNNVATIRTLALTISNTGGNTADADSYTGGRRHSNGGGSSAAMGGANVTGTAAADTGVIVDANPTLVDVSQGACGCVRDGDTWLKTKVSTTNDATISTAAISVANSGLNSADASSNSNGKGSSRAYAGMNSTGNAGASTVVGIAANTTEVHVQN